MGQVVRRADGHNAAMLLKLKPKANPENRRRSERLAVRGLGKILTGAGSLPRDCWISDVSDGGARLHSEGAVPDEFVLILPRATVRRECRVVWRLGHEIGAEFVDQAVQGFARQVAGAR
jgi:hypothetical protein